MAVGDNIDYKHGPAIEREFMRHLRTNVVDDGTPVGRQAKPAKGTVAVKVSDTAPQNDDTNDFPNQLGDYCIHYNAAGVFQNLYVANSGNLTSTCNWNLCT